MRIRWLSNSGYPVGIPRSRTWPRWWSAPSRRATWKPSASRLRSSPHSSAGWPARELPRVGRGKRRGSSEGRYCLWRDSGNRWNPPEPQNETHVNVRHGWWRLASFPNDFGKSSEAEGEMGGFGSGERWSKKTTVESCYSLDTVRLKRWKLLVPGITDRLGFFEWRRGEEEKPSSSVSYLLTVGDHAGTLWLMYTLGSGKESLDYPIRLETTGCHLGGVRWWFTCPLAVNGRVCGRRVRKLYLCGKYFGCRH